uniref:DUF3533 domain-containing protein n=1 Tax=Mycena chlorophos TaxID=658473 RepID=A0ABQ0MAT3_MYCCL|nr:predicted protein [Mycena chlorophos]
MSGLQISNPHPYNFEDQNLRRTSTVNSSSYLIVDEKPAQPPKFQGGFFDGGVAATTARKTYLKAVGPAVGLICTAILLFLPLYWGSVVKSPGGALPGWVVDFDGGEIGAVVTNALAQLPVTEGGIQWTVLNASSFPGGVDQLSQAVLNEEVWYAMAVNPGLTANLTASLNSTDPLKTYNPNNALSWIGVEARNENIYRIHARVVAAQVAGITAKFTGSFLRIISSSDNVPQLLAASSDIISQPVYYTPINLKPFDVLVASAPVFVGLFYLMILSFFVVNVAAGARMMSGVDTSLSLLQLIVLRLVTSFSAYFCLALFYLILNLAFGLPVTRFFGGGGVLIFFFLTWLFILASGLAIESMVTILTLKFVPFFLLLWIISNVSITFFPIEVLPALYGYGWVWPMFNVSQAVRAIVFGTKNTIAINVAVLIVWIILSCLTLTGFQIVVRKKAMAAAAQAGKV